MFIKNKDNQKSSDYLPKKNDGPGVGIYDINK